jgi:VWFA-related protein
MLRRIALFALAFRLFGQDPVFRTESQQVLVPVVVTDEKGRHVGGLKAADFRIFEDGVAQSIASFSTEAAGSLDDLGALAKPAGAGRGMAAARHTFVICLDTLHLSPAGAGRARDALQKLFEKERPGDAQYVLVGIGRQLRVLQAATANPLEIVVKLRGTGFQNTVGGMDGAALSAQLQNLRRRMDEFCKRCACGARSSNCDAETGTLKQTVDEEAANWDAANAGLLDQFRSVVDELAKLPTGRTLILISEGFPMDARRDFYAVVSGYLPNAPQFRVDDSGEKEGPLRAALRTAAGRNVTIDAIDSSVAAGANAAGGGGSMDASDSGSAGSPYSMIGTNRPGRRGTVDGPLQSADSRPQHATLQSSAAMEQLAQATGGIHFRAGGDLLKQLRAALADGREYYLLGYAPKNAERDGKFRAIRVEVANKNLNVRAKPGYWAAQ